MAVGMVKWRIGITEGCARIPNLGRSAASRLAVFGPRRLTRESNVRLFDAPPDAGEDLGSVISLPPAPEKLLNSILQRE